ncbi:tape measure domain-containing protein [Acinetobacter junii]|uniref:tape measure protein n=1 Tax=Acinetobacter junii TaxID=40215 RepID=UPI000F7F9D87|nr:tape measure protein [Acinetobacter junii]RTE46583.1 tape measure domain-containing protein [Acinetobacter junii]
MTTNSLDFLLNLRADTTGFDQGINGSKFAVNALVGALASLGIGLGAKELIEAADSYAMLSAKIQQSTKDSGNFEQAISGVHQIALQTNSTLDNTGALFTRLNTVAKDMGKSQQFALDMTSTVTKAIQLGGSSTQEAEAAVQQFIQAMQGGVLRGEEFNSIMEGGYGLAEALAKGLGVTTGELRKMAENGELSAERVLAALAKQKAGVDAQYAEMPTTISNALQKIATSWQILIGEMDQANGASATVAQWLSVLADNLNIVEVLLDDIGSGFVWFGDQLKKIDPQTIEALKTALLSAYDAIKSLGATVGTVFETTVDVINTTLGQIFNFSSGIDSASDKTNGFTKALQAVNVVFGFLSDGFKAINIGINLIIGAAYDAAGAFSYWKSKITFGDTSAQALKDFEVMSAKAQEYYKKSADGAMEFKSAGVEAIRQIGLTQDEKNAERVANNQKALTDLKAQEAQHASDYKAISDERIKLQQQLVDARKSGDQSAIDAAVAGLAELDKKEKAYQAESKKISDEKIKAAQDWASAQIEAATKGGVALSDNAKKTIEAGVAAQGLAVEFDKTGKAIVKAIEQEAGAAVVSLDSRLAQGRKAAAALGVDLDVALNRVSEGFTTKATALDTFTKNLELMGAKGKEAADVTYEAWSKWLETAKSQAEIDAAKAKLLEFEKQGVFSTKQVEMGMLALKLQTQKAAEATDETTEAFKRLGIQTKEQLKLDAELALAAFNKVQASGQATADGLKQAYERVIQAAIASGDQAVIANAKAKASSLGLQVQIDETGKASVKTTQEIVDGLYNVGKTASGSAAQGFRELGRVAKQEAEDVAETWEQAMARIDKERKAQSAQTAQNLGNALTDNATMAQDFYNQLIAGGMEQGRAEELKREAMVKMGNQLRDVLNGGTAQTRIDALTGRNSSKDWMDNILKLQSKSGSVSASAPKTPSTPNIQAPNININTPNVPSSSAKTVTYKIEFGGKSLELAGDPSQQNLMNDFLSELEQLNRAR